MQTITDKAEIDLFLKNMSQSLTDLSSWKNWYVFEIMAQTPLIKSQQAKITSLIHRLFPTNDGSSLWTEGSVMCILCITGDFNFADFSQALYELRDTPKVTLRMLSMSEECDQLRELIDRYLSNTVLLTSSAQASYPGLKKMVPDIDDLLKNWRAQKKQRKDRTKPLIMLVDDDVMMRTLIQHALKQKYAIIVAKNGRQAMEKHLQDAPDIVFLDIGLPDCDGLELLNYIQQYDNECQIIMFSADSYLKTRIKALSGGASGFVPKPFNKTIFENYISRWVQPPEHESLKSVVGATGIEPVAPTV